MRTPDRKSTRLNSSHSQISYAVFCLKKKKQLQYSRICLLTMTQLVCSSIFFFNDTATTEIYTLSLHDALPISVFDLAFPSDLIPCFPPRGKRRNNESLISGRPTERALRLRDPSSRCVRQIGRAHV